MVEKIQIVQRVVQMKTRNRRNHDVWCRCRKCGDTLTLTLWIRSMKDGKFYARLESAADARAQDGMIYHRPGHCDGILQVFDLPDLS